jgi:hypothetical protein
MSVDFQRTYASPKRKVIVAILIGVFVDLKQIIEKKGNKK